jgi:hypothetical protein
LPHEPGADFIPAGYGVNFDNVSSPAFVGFQRCDKARALQTGKVRWVLAVARSGERLCRNQKNAPNGKAASSKGVL